MTRAQALAEAQGIFGTSIARVRTWQDPRRDGTYGTVYGVGLLVWDTSRCRDRWSCEGTGDTWEAALEEARASLAARKGGAS